MKRWDKTTSLIPLGTQTFSKAPDRYVNGVYPAYLEAAKGCRVTDPDGKEYIEYPCALGAITVGYQDERVTRRVLGQIGQANLLSLPHRLETEVAEQVVNFFPAVEKVRFVKTGSEADQAAIRIARAATGRDEIVTCGYHGWHDWFVGNTHLKAGVPKVVQKLVKQATYNDLGSFQRAITTKTAAVILEPYVFDMPQGDFLNRLWALCQSKGVLLIFDEIVTAIRSLHGSAQKQFNIRPDLTTFGKGLGNGYPVAGLGGRADLMALLEKDCFVSGTYGGELVSLAAASEVLRIAEQHQIWEHIWEMGSRLIGGFNRFAEHHKLNAKCIGQPPRSMFMFPSESHKTVFWQECLKRGILFGHAQFISWAHKIQDIDRTVVVMQEVLELMRQQWDQIDVLREGDIIQGTLRRPEEKRAMMAMLDESSEEGADDGD